MSKRTCIGNALRDISNKSKLYRAEKGALRNIAKEYDNLEAARASTQAVLEAKHTQVTALAAELEKHHWIPVSERPPEERDEVVPFRSNDVFGTNGTSARIVYWMTRQKYWRYAHGVGHPKPITHWKPIDFPLSTDGKKESRGTESRLPSKEKP